MEAEIQGRSAAEDCRTTPYGNREPCHFLDGATLTGYYDYTDESIPLVAVTKASEYRRRWTSVGMLVATGLAGVVAFGGLTNQAFPVAPVVVPPLAQFWEVSNRGPWTLNIDSFSEQDWLVLFKEFFERFNKNDEYTISSPEYYKRFEVFKENTKLISLHNREAAQGLHDVSLAPNQFTDMDWKEFRSRHLSPPTLGEDWTSQDLTSRIDGSHLLSAIANQTIPDEVNWIDRGCVTPVKNQAHCGSCWAFSSTGAIEGAVCAQANLTLSLSEQQLVDCARSEGTMGCHGGFMTNAFQYIIDNKGICAEEAYPYVGIDTEVCRAQECKPVVKVKGIMDIPSHDEKAIRAALALYGPVSVAIEADRPVFQFYHQGVMNLKCGKHLNHAVLAVGYGTDTNTGEHYWLIKNSWGTTWGAGGYIKLTRDKRRKNGECGVLLAPVLPIVDV